MLAILVSFTIKLCTYPVMVMSRKQRAVMAKYKPEIDNYQQRIKIAKIEGSQLHGTF